MREFGVFLLGMLAAIGYLRGAMLDWHWLKLAPLMIAFAAAIFILGVRRPRK